MTMANFFSTYPGMYATQSFLHALIAVIMVDMAIQAWKIDNPSVRQRFRFAVILYAIVSFPLYQLINPERSSVFFRLEALFDSSQWLGMDLFGMVPLRLPFLVLLSITTLVFLFQELIPILQHTFESNQDVPGEGGPDDEALVARALASLPGPKPEVVILNDDELVLFSSSGKKASIFISTGLLRSLSLEQVQAALAHEAAHVARNRRPVLIVVFILRVIMFFNPVVLVEFRRAVRNEEKICDDIAVSLTQNPHALAETLKKFYSRHDDPQAAAQDRPAPAKVPLEDYSHNLQLEGRIMRLEQGMTQKPDDTWFPFILVLLIIAGVNYFVV
jgi:Zn-dependent protease with chaperone function